MRVLQVIDNLRVGGAQRLLVTLAALASSRGIDLTIASFSDDPESPIPASLAGYGATVDAIIPRGLLDPLFVRRMAQYLRRGKFDVIQTHLSTANILGTFSAKSARIPAIATLHSAASRPSNRHRLDRVLETLALRFAARNVVAVGHLVADAHQSRLGNRPITVIPNAVPTSEPLDAAERRRVRCDLIGDPERRLLISVGRLTEAKGFHDLIRAVEMLRSQHPDVAAVIVGEGHLRDPLQRQINDAQLQNHVFLTGARNDVPRLLASSDIYVSTSHWEGLPLTVLEAMMAGLPIIATNVGEIPRVLENGAGLLVPPKSPERFSEAIAELLCQPDRLSDIGERARDRAMKEYSATRWIDRMVALYSEARSGVV